MFLLISKDSKSNKNIILNKMHSKIIHICKIKLKSIKNIYLQIIKYNYIQSDVVINFKKFSMLINNSIHIFLKEHNFL